MAWTWPSILSVLAVVIVEDCCKVGEMNVWQMHPMGRGVDFGRKMMFCWIGGDVL